MMRTLEVKIRQILWSFKRCFKPTTYDCVKYKGEKYYIKSSLCGHNIWDLYEKGNQNPIFKYIKGKDLKIIHSLKRFKVVFNQHLRFQKTSWGLIDCSNPIGTRLSYNNSNDIHFKNKNYK